MQQLVLDIGRAPEPEFANFIAGPNAEALARVQELAAGRLREAIVYLWGEPGTGRSHLLRAALRENPGLVAADDVETLNAAAQQALFVAIVAGKPVLAAGGKPPAQLRLREDLRTRLASGLVYQLKPPGDEEKAFYLRGEAARRSLRLSDEVVAYLLTRLPRDLASLNAVLESLDRYSLQTKRPVTLPLVRQALEKRS